MHAKYLTDYPPTIVSKLTTHLGFLTNVSKRKCFKLFCDESIEVKSTNKKHGQYFAMRGYSSLCPLPCPTKLSSHKPDWDFCVVSNFAFH